MTLSRRSVLAASLEIGGATGLSTLAHAAPRSDPHVTDLIRLSEESNAALLRGDIKTYLDLLSVSRDFTLMSPFGGKPSHGTEYTRGRWEEIGRFFANGRLVHRHAVTVAVSPWQRTQPPRHKERAHSEL